MDFPEYGGVWGEIEVDFPGKFRFEEWEFITLKGCLPNFGRWDDNEWTVLDFLISEDHF